jgi:hypothetical protein
VAMTRIPSLSRTTSADAMSRGSSPYRSILRHASQSTTAVGGGVQNFDCILAIIRRALSSGSPDVSSMAFQTITASCSSVLSCSGRAASDSLSTSGVTYSSSTSEIAVRGTGIPPSGVPLWRACRFSSRFRRRCSCFQCRVCSLCMGGTVARGSDIFADGVHAHGDETHVVTLGRPLLPARPHREHVRHQARSHTAPDSGQRRSEKRTDQSTGCAAQPCASRPREWARSRDPARLP